MRVGVPGPVARLECASAIRQLGADDVVTDDAFSADATCCTERATRRDETRACCTRNNVFMREFLPLSFSRLAIPRDIKSNLRSCLLARLLFAHEAQSYANSCLYLKHSEMIEGLFLIRFYPYNDNEYKQRTKLLCPLHANASCEFKKIQTLYIYTQIMRLKAIKRRLEF